MDLKAGALRVGGWKLEFFLFSHLEYNKWKNPKQNKTNTYLPHEQLDLLLLWFYCVFVCHFLLDLHHIKIQIIYLQM